MLTVTPQPTSRDQAVRRETVPSVRPSAVAASQPSLLAQELEPFATWTGAPIWVPPKDSSTELAKSMLSRYGLFHSNRQRWAGIVQEHRKEFTQVREIELSKASIRLPKGKLFVSVTEREQFGDITDPIPNCVRTRLEEFLEGPGKERGVKVYYLKPLCVEVGDELVFTTQESVNEAIRQIQKEVFAEYRRMYLCNLPKYMAVGAVNAGLAVPRMVVDLVAKRRQKAIDAYHARLEFKRRKTALRAARMHCRLRTDGCTFDEMLSLTNPLERLDVIEQYGIEQNLSRAKRNRMMRNALEGLEGLERFPWFMTLSISAAYLTKISLTLVPPIALCDPAFVAEMPRSAGVLLKIGHFDEVRGVTHVEI